MSVLELFSLAGKTIVITGAGSGLGRAIAEACAEAGAAVICAGRSETVDETATDLTGQGFRAWSIRCDVSDESQVEALMLETVRLAGPPDAVFCNAGTSDHYKRADETSRAEWDRVLAVDLTGVFLTAKHAIRVMLPNGGGKIVTVASIWGEIASDTIPIPAYASAKAGVIGLTKELAVEYIGQGITVNAISPGFFETRIGWDKQLDGDVIERLLAGALRRAPAHRLMKPGEVKGTAVYLASQASDAVNGHILTVDGGTTAA